MKISNEYQIAPTDAFEKLLGYFNDGTKIQISERKYIKKLLKKFYLEYHNKGGLQYWVTYTKVNAANEFLSSIEEFIFKEHKIVIETNCDFYHNMINIQVKLIEDPVHPGIYKRDIFHPLLKSQKYYYKKVMPLHMDEEVAATSERVNEI